ncbi:MAG: hypothetical protein Q8873_00515 [Bacillota bacterium]|nr:hypothetical protein [Bacillota bacterium]
MSLTPLTFTPTNGYNDSVTFPDPPTETAARAQIQELHDQAKNYINNTLVPEVEKKVYISFADIHNGNFLSPENQRVITSGTTYSTTGAIYLDRWWLVSGSMVWTSKTGFALNGVAKQRIEELPEWLFEKEQPITISVGGTEYRDTLTWPASSTGATSSVTKNGVTITIGFESYSATLCGISSTYTPYITLTTSSSTTINYIYPDKPPADYGEELTKCQRFALYIPNGGGYFRVGSYTANTLLFSVPLTNTFRAIPTIESGSFSVMTAASVVQSGFTFTFYVNGNNLTVIASKTSHGLTDATLYSNGILLTADL